MTKSLILPSVSHREQFTAKQVDAVQSSTLRVEPEDGDSELVGPHPRGGNHATTSEDQGSTTVSSDDGRRMLNQADLHVPCLVFDPRQIGRTVEVASLNRSSRGHNCVRCAEVDHPVAAQFDCFIVRDSPRFRLRRLSFHKTSLPETAVLATWEVPPGDRMSALARSLTPPTSSRRNAPIGDWS
jgi:hypothetical protein